MSKTQSKAIRPSILTFNRSISPGNAMMSMRTNGENERPLVIREISARGVQSSEGIAEEKKEQSNPQTYECAFLDGDANQLVVSFDVDFDAVGAPSAVGDRNYHGWISGFIESYRQEHGFRKLGHLYAWNLANGRFLWRNQRNAHTISVKLTLINEEGKPGEEFKFVASDISKDEPPADNLGIQTVGDYIAQGLNGDRTFASIRVEAVVTGSYGREVFPSQSMVMPGSGSKLSKHLFCIDVVKGRKHAGMHSQKIGNAIRTIDMWYGKLQPISLPIAVEVFGTVSNQSFAYRAKDNDFYTLIDNAKKFEDKVKGASEPSENALHYIFAVLVRGGVFNAEKQKD